MKKNLIIILTAVVLAFSSCKKEPVRVACVGDSITYGHGIKDRLHDAYPGVLSSMLGDKYDVRNFGVSGTTTMT
ncbi:MAG: xylanase, partial [Bacteroidaceae bacterium]|nr:xylanase [Bacteroidaceae bacterium]